MKSQDAKTEIDFIDTDNRQISKDISPLKIFHIEIVLHENQSQSAPMTQTNIRDERFLKPPPHFSGTMEAAHRKIYLN